MPSSAEVEDYRKQYVQSLTKCDANHGRYSMLTMNFSSVEYYLGDFDPVKTSVAYHLLTKTEKYCIDGFECAPQVHLCVPCQFGKYCPPGSVRYNNSALVNICPKGHLCKTPKDKELCPASFACGFGSASLNSPVTPSCSNYENNVAVYCPEGSSLSSQFTFENLCKGGYYCPKGGNGTNRQILCPEGHFCYEGVAQPIPCTKGLLVDTTDFGFKNACSYGRSYPSYDVFQTVQLLIVLLFLYIISKGIIFVKQLLKTYSDKKLKKLYKTKSEAAFLKFIKSSNDDALHDNRKISMTGSTKKLNIVLKEKGLLSSVENNMILDMFDHIDIQHHGKISKSELEKFLTHQMERGKSNSNVKMFSNPLKSNGGTWKQKVRSIFKKYDKDQTGYLDKESFQQLFREFDSVQRKSEVDQKKRNDESNNANDFLTGVSNNFTGFKADHRKYSIQFNGLGLSLKSNHKVVLKNVTGEFFHSQLIAIMGPSGCGKSTFLNTLSGRAYYGHKKGVMQINHKDDTLLNHRKSVGFVPQEDTVFDMLTVYENLMYSCELRLLGSTKSKRKRIVEDVIHLLELEKIRHSVVGSVEKRGISGGQRKRVNIGMELVADPSIIFLDEPTSGLDSASASVVLSALKDLTHLGITIIAVIHQPKYSIFELFDQLLLLGTGGETVFCGPVSYVKDYFASLDFKMREENANLADFIIDVCAGIIPRENHPSYLPSDLPKLWEKRGVEVVKEYQNHHDDVRLENAGKQNDGSLSPNDLSKFLKSLRSYLLITSNKKLFLDDLTALCKLIDRDGILPRKSLNIIKRFVHSLIIEESSNEHKKRYSYKSIYTKLKRFVEITNKNAKNSRANRQKKKKARGRKFRASMMDFKEANSMLNYTNQAQNDNDGKAYKSILTQDNNDNTNKNGKTLMQIFWTGWHQYWILQHRCFIILVYNNWKRILSDTFILILCGIITGGMTQSTVSSLNYPILPIALTLCVTLLGVLSAVSATNIFGGTKLLYFRERASNLYVFPYFISRILLDIVTIVLKSFAFGSIFFDVATPLIGRLELVAVFAFTAYAASPIGYMISIIVNDKPSTVAITAAVTFILGGLMTGLNPELATVKTYAFPLPQLYDLSFGRWAVEGILSEWIVKSPFPYMSTAKDFFEDKGYEIYAGRWETNIVSLFIIGTFLRFVTLILLITINRDKQLHLKLGIVNKLCFWNKLKNKQKKRMAMLQRDVLKAKKHTHHHHPNKSHFKFDKKRSSVLTDILEDHNYDHGHEKHIASGNGSITSNVRNFNTSSESKPVAVMVEMRMQKNPLHHGKGKSTWVENPLKP